MRRFWGACRCSSAPLGGERLRRRSSINSRNSYEGSTPIKLRVRRLSYNDIRRISEQFLREFHAERSIPTPIEEIAEFKCRLDIIPLPGLRDLLEIDGFISSDLSSITVDQQVAHL